MSHRDTAILKKILSEINIAFEMLGDTDLNAFLNDEKLKRAVGMTVINIGELVKNISEETRLAHKEIPWKAVAGMRDIATHKYLTLRMEDVYNTVAMDFPGLKKQITAIIDSDVRGIAE